MAIRTRIPHSALLPFTTNLSKEYMTYESPDHGETVFHRMAGALERTLVSRSPVAIRTERHRLWYKIIEAAANNQALEEAIAKAESIYAEK
jgi:hypothetical protein